MEGLDDDAKSPHDHGGKGIDEDGSLETRGHIECGVSALGFDLMHEAHEDACRNVGIGNAGEVNEGRIAHNTTEGVEREEGHNIRHEADGKAKGELPEMLCKTESAILEIVDGETRKEHSGTIHRKDAPIGQCSSREVPVTEFTNGVHII